MAFGTLPSMTIENAKVRENRLRRMAERQGLRLIKSRRRDTRAYDYGTYVLVDQETTALVTGHYGPGYGGASLDEIEEALWFDAS